MEFWVLFVGFLLGAFIFLFLLSLGVYICLLISDVIGRLLYKMLNPTTLEEKQDMLNDYYENHLGDDEFLKAMSVKGISEEEVEEFCKSRDLYYAGWR